MKDAVASGRAAQSLEGGGGGGGRRKGCKVVGRGWNGHGRGGSLSPSRCDGSGASSSIRKPVGGRVLMWSVDRMGRRLVMGRGREGVQRAAKW